MQKGITMSKPTTETESTMKKDGTTDDAMQSADLKARWKEFWEDHKDFDSAWLRNMLHNLAEFLPFIFKFDAVGDGLTMMYRNSIGKLPPDFDWIGAEEYLSAADLSRLPGFRLALALRAYAYYGLMLEMDESEDVHGLQAFLEHAEMDLIPIRWGGDEETERTIEAALARRKLDWNSAEGLSPEELAALVGLRRKNIVNLLAPAKRASGTHGVLETGPNGRITVESARRWLLARPDFRPSIWQHQEDAPLGAPWSEALLEGDPVFVPVSSDRSWFSPEHRNERDGHYYVASGDCEEKYKDYWSALEFLSRAASPRWRYRDSIGRWRMKNGTDWLRKTRQEIEALLEGSNTQKSERSRA